jgi:hypothetical protein
VTPAFSAAAMTSASRTEPPGCTIARTPASTSTSRPSGNGKNASDAPTEPLARSPARETASRDESTRLTWPMPTPTVAPSAASRIAFDLTERSERHANSRSRRVCSSAGVPVASVHDAGSSPGALIASTVCTSTPPEIWRNSIGAGRSIAGSFSSRMFFLRCRISRASASKSGASTTSVNTSAICSAASRLTGRFVAMTPP